MPHKKNLLCKRLKHKWEWKEVRVAEMKGSGKRAHQRKYVCSRCGKVLVVRQPMPDRFYEQKETTGPYTNMFKDCRLLTEDELKSIFLPRSEKEGVEYD